MSKSQQTQGASGEQAAEIELRRLGVYNVAKVPTPIGISRRGTGRFAGWVKIFYKEKVLGDRRGELANGISVLAEVKTTRDKNLTWSAFSGVHQPKALDNHLGLSLLVWVCDTAWSRDVFVMDWNLCKDAGFRPHHGITPEMAVEIAKNTLAIIDKKSQQCGE